MVLVLLGGIQQQWIQGVDIPQNHQELHRNQGLAGQHSLHSQGEYSLRIFPKLSLRIFPERSLRIFPKLSDYFKALS